MHSQFSGFVVLATDIVHQEPTKTQHGLGDFHLSIIVVIIIVATGGRSDRVWGICVFRFGPVLGLVFGQLVGPAGEQVGVALERTELDAVCTVDGVVRVDGHGGEWGHGRLLGRVHVMSVRGGSFFFFFNTGKGVVAQSTVTPFPSSCLFALLRFSPFNQPLAASLEPSTQDPRPRTQDSGPASRETFCHVA